MSKMRKIMISKFFGMKNTAIALFFLIVITCIMFTMLVGTFWEYYTDYANKKNLEAISMDAANAEDANMTEEVDTSDLELPQKENIVSKLFKIIKTGELYDRLNSHFIIPSFSNLYIKILYWMTGDIQSNKVLLGKNNWLFYKGDSSISDYSGEVSYSVDEMTRITANLTEIKDVLAERGTEFLVIIPPNKERVYAEYMPQDIRRISMTGRTDRLIEHIINNSNVSILNPMNALLEAKEMEDVYYQFDTHWNFVGGYIGYQEILAELYGEKLKLEKKWVYKLDILQPNDLCRMIGFEDEFLEDEFAQKEWIVSRSGTLSNYPQCFNYTDFLKKYGEGIVNYSEGNAKYKESILFFGDSFGISMIPYFKEDFSEVYVTSIHNYDKAIFEELSPDIVVVECVERATEELLNLY